MPSLNFLDSIESNATKFFEIVSIIDATEPGFFFKLEQKIRELHKVSLLLGDPKFLNENLLTELCDKIIEGIRNSNEHRFFRLSKARTSRIINMIIQIVLDKILSTSPFPISLADVEKRIQLSEIPLKQEVPITESPIEAILIAKVMDKLFDIYSADLTGINEP